MLVTKLINSASLYPDLLKSLKETFIMLSISNISAILLGIPLGTILYLSKKKLLKNSKIIETIVDSFINITRSFPFLLLVVGLMPFTRAILGTSFGTYASCIPLSIVAISLLARFIEQNLLELPDSIIELSKILGANKTQLVFEMLYIEACPNIILSITSVIISILSYSTVMGILGGGGIGDFAVRYGYQRYEYQIMYLAVFIMILFVFIVQKIGDYISLKLDNKHKKR